MVRASILGLLVLLAPRPAVGQATGAQAPAAQAPPAVVLPEGARIAYVQLQDVLAKSKLGQRLSADLKTLTDQRDGELAGRQQEIADLETQLSGPARQSMTQAAANALVATLNRKRAELNFEQESWQIRLEDASQSMLADFREKMLPVVEAVREERGLLLVLSLPFPGVVAVDTRLDLSAELIRKLDEQSR
jgi:Skp family chaperone for outer membrane proteins